MWKKTLFIPALTFICMSSAVTSVFAQADEIDGGGQYLNPTQSLRISDFNALNPLSISNFGTAGVSDQLNTPAGIINRILVFAFPLAGLILFVMLLWAGFEIVSGATNKKSLDAGRERATAALLGFLLLFVSYWLIQIIEIIFGAKIL